MATGDVRGTVILWDVARPAEPRRAGDIPGSPRARVRSMTFTRDGRTLATLDWPTGTTGAVDGTVTLWDVRERSAPRRLGVLPGVQPAEPLRPRPRTGGGAAAILPSPDDPDTPPPGGAPPAR
jgi:WD40 repeat protein